jgi:hypothetical protein
VATVILFLTILAKIVLAAWGIGFTLSLLAAIGGLYKGAVALVMFPLWVLYAGLVPCLLSCLWLWVAP